jgi:hypothetical protein
MNGPEEAVAEVVQNSSAGWPMSRTAMALALFNPRHNATRGKIAEILVARLTGGVTTPEYEDFDVLVDGRIKLQVKASGFLQSWATPGQKFSKIGFKGLRSCKLLDDGSYATVETFNADVYVFCVHLNQDHGAPDTELNPDLWDFYVAPLEAITQAGVASMALSRVQKIAVKASAHDLGMRVRAA